jgi:predicted HTH domain antitoxin
MPVPTVQASPRSTGTVLQRRLAIARCATFLRVSREKRTFDFVILEIPEEALGGLVLDPNRARLDLAVGLYTEGGVSIGRAARVAQMSQANFRGELGRRGIVMRYDIDDLRADLETLAALREK